MKARRGWAWPLVPLYAAALVAKDGLRGLGILRTRRLEWPVVSVGSLSAGGAGKTPVVIALAELLGGRGWRVDVLSRGYGRAGRGVERVEPDGADAARRFGDEPVVIARGARVPVWVGGDRFAAGSAAEASDGEAGVGRRVHLLDDGFQHRQLARGVDIVLVTAEDLEEALLPAGNRREFLGALRRADMVLLREEERGRIEVRVRGLMQKDATLWTVRRDLCLPDDLGANSLAFCGVARPEDFFSALAQAGCRVVETAAFGDHHVYEDADVERLATSAAEHGATGFITTEKDAVKLSAGMLERLRLIGPVRVAGLAVRFPQEEGVARDLEARLR